MPRGAWIQTRRAGPGVRVSGAYGMHRIASDAPPSSAHIHRLRAAGGVIANVVRRPAHKREEVQSIARAHARGRAVLAFAFCHRFSCIPLTPLAWRPPDCCTHKHKHKHTGTPDHPARTTTPPPRTTTMAEAQERFQEPPLKKPKRQKPAPPTSTSPLFLLLPDLALHLIASYCPRRTCIRLSLTSRWALQCLAGEIAIEIRLVWPEGLPLPAPGIEGDNPQHRRR